MKAGPRAAARKAGLVRYSPGFPCSKGHEAERLTSNGACVVCNNIKSGAHQKAKRALKPKRVRCTPHEYYLRYKETRRRYRENNPDVVAASYKRWCQKNVDHIRRRSALWRENNPEKYKAYHAYENRKVDKAAWRARNSEKWAARSKAWRQLNKPKRAAYESRRRAEKRQRTPTTANLLNIEYFYEWAARQTALTGVPHEVDHIVPLRGKNVCGLHVDWNMRVIPKSENRRKHNQLIEDLALAA